MKMDLKYFIIVFIGFVCVLECQGKDLSRQRRDGGTNVIEIFLQVQQILNSCKKDNPPPPNNQTNIVEQILESYDIECLVNGFMKVIKDFDNSDNSRRKRDTGNLIMELLQLQENIQKCKKSDPPATNSTNILEKIMNDYDIECLAKTVMDFIKTVSQSNDGNQRSKRALQFSDITCFLMKAIDEEPKFQKVIQAFRPKESNKGQDSTRKKRAASTQQICDDFGSAMDAVLKLVLDFAPNQTS